MYVPLDAISVHCHSEKFHRIRSAHSSLQKVHERVVDVNLESVLIEAPNSRSTCVSQRYSGDNVKFQKFLEFVHEAIRNWQVRLDIIADVIEH